MDDALEGYNLWKSKAEGNSACDYTFHMAVTKFEDETEGQFAKSSPTASLPSRFSSPTRISSASTTARCTRCLQLAKKLGVIVTAHCENAELVGRLQQALLAEGKTGPEWHEPSRPEAVEAEGTQPLRDVSGNHRRGGLRRASLLRSPRWSAPLAAKSRGVRLWVESVLPHLPARQNLRRTARRRRHEARHVAAAARPAAIRRCCGTRWRPGPSTPSAPIIAPSTPRRSCWARTRSRRFPTAFPAIEERVNLLYTYGVQKGTLDLHRFVDAARTRAAKLFGLFPRKGAIAVGQRRRPGDLRSRLSRHHLRRHAAHQLRLQRLRRHADRRPAVGGHGPRQGAGARRRNSSASRPRPDCSGASRCISEPP